VLAGEAINNAAVAAVVEDVGQALASRELLALVVVQVAAAVVHAVAVSPA
jgi:hypothetical protein